MIRIAIVSAALFVLVGASYWVTGLSLGGWAMAAALGFSSVKAGLIGWEFMELRQASTSIRVAVAVALFLVVLLIVLVIVDVATREPVPLLPPVQ